MSGFHRLGEKLFSMGLTRRDRLGSRLVGGDTIAPTVTIATSSVAGNIASMTITFSEVVIGFVVGDITISAGGSLASFETTDNIIFTVNWTLASGLNTMDIAAGVCQDAAGNNNTAATQFVVTRLVLQPNATAGKDTALVQSAPDVNYGGAQQLLLGDFDAAAICHVLVQFDYSSVPANATVLSSQIKLKVQSLPGYSSVVPEVLDAHPLLRNWLEAEATYNIYSTGNNWQAAGGVGAADIQAAAGSCLLTIKPSPGDVLAIDMLASKVQEWIHGDLTNYGVLLKQRTEAGHSNCMYVYSSDAPDAGNRPIMETVYTVPFDFSDVLVGTFTYPSSIGV